MTPVPKTPETYGYPVPRRLALMCVPCFLIACSAAVLWWRGGDARFLWISGGTFLVGLLLSTCVVWRSSQTLTTDAEGVTWRLWGCPPKHLPWNQVRRLRLSQVTQALEMEVEGGHPVLKIPYALPDFDRLHEVIRQAAPQLLAGNDGGGEHPHFPVAFRTSLVPFLSLVGFSAASVVMGFVLLPRDQAGAILCFGLALFLAAIVPLFPHSLVVQADRIVVKALLRSRETSLADINAVEAKMVDIGRGGVQLQLWVTLINGKEIKLVALKETLRAQEVIEAARQRLTLGSSQGSGSNPRAQKSDPVRSRSSQPSGPPSEG